MLKGMGMGPGGPGGPFGPPGGFGFGPGNFLAPAILQRADSKKAGKVSVEQLVSAAETLFKEADKNKDGKLNEAELGAAIGKLFPAPPGGFGPPGFGPKDPPKPGPKVKPEDVTSQRRRPHVCLMATATGRQGAALDLTYRVRFRSGSTPTALVGELNHIEGVHNVELRRQQHGTCSTDRENSSPVAQI
jgi:hypothetical protein